MQSQSMMIPCDKKEYREMERALKDASKKNSPVTKQTLVLPGKVFYSNSNSPLVNKSLLSNHKLSGKAPPILSFAGALNSNPSLQNYLLLQNQFASVQSNLDFSSPGPSKSKSRNSKGVTKSIAAVKSITDVSSIQKPSTVWKFPQPFQATSLRGSPVQHSKTKDRDGSLQKAGQTNGLSGNTLSPATPTGHAHNGDMINSYLDDCKSRSKIELTRQKEEHSTAGVGKPEPKNQEGWQVQIRLS